MSKQVHSIEALFKKDALLAFGAKWCGPFNLLDGVLKNIKASGIEVVLIDVDENAELSDKLAVVSLPTFIVVKGGREKNRKLGSVSQEELEEMVEVLK